MDNGRIFPVRSVLALVQCIYQHRHHITPVAWHTVPRIDIFFSLVSVLVCVNNRYVRGGGEGIEGMILTDKISLSQINFDQINSLQMIAYVFHLVRVWCEPDASIANFLSVKIIDFPIIAYNNPEL